jgi:hypothetical protein
MSHLIIDIAFTDHRVSCSSCDLAAAVLLVAPEVHIHAYIASHGCGLALHNHSG